MRRCELPEAVRFCTDYESCKNRLHEIHSSPTTNTFTDAALAQKMAQKLLERGVYVIGFSYPVVPRGAARIRTQISAAHNKEDLDFAIEKIAEVKQELGI